MLYVRTVAMAAVNGEKNVYTYRKSFLNGVIISFTYLLAVATGVRLNTTQEELCILILLVQNRDYLYIKT